jgi:hypothetical protein
MRRKGTIDVMSSPARSPLTAVVNRILSRMRYPYLFLILGALFLVDLVVPDPIPLVDEILLAVLTFIAATFTTRENAEPEPRDVTPLEEDPRVLSPGEDSRPADDG